MRGRLRFAVLAFLLACGPAFAQTRFLDLSKAANMGPGTSFESDASGVPGAEKADGLSALPTGSKTLRGVPFRLLDPSSNQGHHFVALKGSRKPDLPEAVSIPGGLNKAPYLYFLHTCRWGGTGPDVTVAEYNVIYGDGKVEVIPLRVGVEFANFFGADDTGTSFLAWWHKYKKIEMGVSLFPWKNPRPEEPVQSILFKSRGRMPVPILFAVTASDRELPIVEASPKPEKEFRTDTTGWLPFEPSDASPKGTAIDMSFLLDAPAGKHGKVKAEGDKLVFADGTPARFCGTQWPSDWCSYSTEKMRIILDRMAVRGWNLVRLLPPSKRSGHPCEAALEALTGLSRERGIYLSWTEDPKVDALPHSLFLQEKDPILVSDTLFHHGGYGSRIDITSDVLAVRSKRHQGPWVLAPTTGPLPFLIGQRALGKPFMASWTDLYPSPENSVEFPLLLSSMGVLQDWACLLFLTTEGVDLFSRSLGPRTGVWNDPGFLSHGPSASLAYLRGDLREGKTYAVQPLTTPTLTRDEGELLRMLAHRSGVASPDSGIRTDPTGSAKAKIDAKNKTFTSDTGQITWQGNVGVVKVESPRFQALIGFLANRKFNNGTWAVETKNLFASISAISLTKSGITGSDRVLLTAVARMENTGQVYNEKRTKLLDPGKAPILREPVQAKVVLYRGKMDPTLKVRALDQAGQTLPIKVPTKWVGKNLVLTWVPEAIHLEVYKALK